MIAIKYIGVRPTYRDGAYASGIEFKSGETKFVPKDIAAKMLKHHDVYEAGIAGVNIATAKVNKAEMKEDTDESLQAMRDAVQAMGNKDTIADFAMVNYRMKIAKNLSVDNMRREAIRMIDQFGVM